MARVRQAYQELKKLTKEKKLVDVVLGLETFTGMAITSFVIDRDAETGANLPFTMEFRKLKIVHSDTTQINASGKEAGPAGDQTAGTTNAGIAGTEQSDNNIAKAQWRLNVKMRGESREAKNDYFREWGVPYAQ
jgi:hypothetical protein